MIDYTSFMKPMIDCFIKYQIASQHWNEISYGRNLKTFENHCLNKFPEATSLTQKMVDSWCNQRDTEKNKSYSSRIYVIVTFIKYTNSRNLTNLKVPELPKKDNNTYIPHAFTDDELHNFFKACDTIRVKVKNQESLSQKLSIPVFFRLLYSSGMRTTEARLLKKNNIDLASGVINIEQSKGYHQHYVVLHDSMKELLIQYNIEISKLYPNRTYFFPARKNSYHQKDWVSKNFKKMWKQHNSEYAVAYDLRHHYAITNINSWVNQGVEFTANLYYLSKSMGHSTIESTKYYYSLVPCIADVIDIQLGKEFDVLIPEVKYND